MRGGGGCGVSANEYSCAHGAQINFGDLTPYITCSTCYETPASRRKALGLISFVFFQSTIHETQLWGEPGRRSQLLLCGPSSWGTDEPTCPLHQYIAYTVQYSTLSIKGHYSIVQKYRALNIIIVKNFQTCIAVICRIRHKKSFVGTYKCQNKAVNLEV